MHNKRVKMLVRVILYAAGLAITAIQECLMRRRAMMSSQKPSFFPVSSLIPSLSRVKIGVPIEGVEEGVSVIWLWLSEFCDECELSLSLFSLIFFLLLKQGHVINTRTT